MVRENPWKVQKTEERDLKQSKRDSWMTKFRKREDTAMLKEHINGNF